MDRCKRRSGAEWMVAHGLGAARNCYGSSARGIVRVRPAGRSRVAVCTVATAAILGLLAITEPGRAQCAPGWLAGTGTNGAIYSLVVLPDGDVVAGGNFTVAGGVAATRIARYRPATNMWSALGSGT